MRSSHVRQAEDLKIYYPLFSDSRHSEIELKNDELHIWSVLLDQTLLQLEMLSETLSPDERTRAKRFFNEKTKRHFIMRHGILRNLLSRYLHVKPDRLLFSYGKYGKPGLAHTIGRSTIRFNMSCSEGLALYAFTRDREIGVDVEHIRDIPEMDQIAEKIFSSRERILFCALPEGKKRKAFFNHWTRKEAFVKAIGKGLHYSLNKCDVSLPRNKFLIYSDINGDSLKASEWYVQDFNPASGFAAAYAVKGTSRLRLYHRSI